MPQGGGWTCPSCGCMKAKPYNGMALCAFQRARTVNRRFRQQTFHRWPGGGTQAFNPLDRWTLEQSTTVFLPPPHPPTPVVFLCQVVDYKLFGSGPCLKRFTLYSPRQLSGAVQIDNTQARNNTAVALLTSSVFLWVIRKKSMQSMAF